MSTLLLILLLILPVSVHAAGPKSLLECRTEAARQAKTEAGARAMLADCAKRFPESASPQPRELSETECLRQGKFYREVFVGPKCVDEDPWQRVCEPSELAHNARSKVSKAECKKRGDIWHEKGNFCQTQGSMPFVFVCANEQSTDETVRPAATKATSR